MLKVPMIFTQQTKKIRYCNECRKVSGIDEVHKEYCSFVTSVQIEPFSTAGTPRALDSFLYKHYGVPAAEKGLRKYYL